MESPAARNLSQLSRFQAEMLKHWFLPKMSLLRVFTLIATSFRCSAYAEGDPALVVVTVATEQTDGYKRFERSAQLYGFNVEVFGLDQDWLGGDVSNGPGGGHKINILRRGLKKYENVQNLVLMFTDSYDVILTGTPKEALEKFRKFNASVVFSAEDFCWPDQSLANEYPPVGHGYRFLCSGGIIGYAADFYRLLTFSQVGNTDDDQLYYTQIYLNHRDKFSLKLDSKAELFQNLNGNREDVELEFDGASVRLKNKRFNSFPVVVHGNGPSKLYLNHLGNYLANGWTFDDGCSSCKEGVFSLQDRQEAEWPRILVGLFIESPTPFIPAFLQHISNLEYPKHRIDIFLHNAEPHHDAHVEEWSSRFSQEYSSFTYKGPRSQLREDEARDMGLQLCQQQKCDYYFSVDGSVTLSNRKALQVLIEQNRTFLVPMMSKPGKLWSNFWGALSEDGYYARSPDYIDIVKSVRRGIWNSPYVSSIYLIRASVLRTMPPNPFLTKSSSLESDMEFCRNMRKQGIFMYVTNLQHFGHLKETETYTTKFKHNDMYQIVDNKLDWEDQYRHPDYTKFLDPGSEQEMPCPDVYWFPFVTVNFTQHLIEECENFGQWSGGTHQDSRIAGGYENVPTVDIHMNQIGFEKEWLQMLKDYVAPMATRYFLGYYSKSHAIMNFVVKYTTSGQYFLRPHHDASTFTINLALNRAGIDYEGGGARFIRYNCSVPGTKVGWALMHPGRLTHYHEGLPITKGTRYIMVSFIDP